MQILLVHNNGAGKEAISAESLMAILADSGANEVQYLSTEVEKYAESIMPDAYELIVVAGGDGTVGKVIPRLLGSPVPLGILPFGTANNIAKHIGCLREPEHLLGLFKDNQTKLFYTGTAKGNWGEKVFIESVGFGVFSRLLSLEEEHELVEDANHESRESEVDHAKKILKELVEVYEAKHFNIFLDGEDYSGEYLLVEIMNIKSVGPRMQLAPDAAFDDDWFDVILIRASERARFQNFLSDENAPPVIAIKATNIEISCKHPHLHIDDHIMQIGNLDEENKISIQLNKEGVHILSPQI